MGVVGGSWGATSSEREGDRERTEAPSGAQLRMSIECLERILVQGRLKPKTRNRHIK
jgi:hypothetical protein